MQRIVYHHVLTSALSYRVSLNLWLPLSMSTRTSRARHEGAAGNRKYSDMNSEYNRILQIRTTILCFGTLPKTMGYPDSTDSKSDLRNKKPLLSFSPKLTPFLLPSSSFPPPLLPYLLPSPPGAAPPHTHPAHKPSEPTECNDK